MTVANRLMATVLQSPLHRLADGKVCLVRYTAHRSGRQVTLPVQYVAPSRGHVVIAVARDGSKTWWRNFRDPHPAELCLAGRWQPMTLHVATGDARADAVRAYAERFRRSQLTPDDVVIVGDGEPSP